jgi:hypothetical protein
VWWEQHADGAWVLLEMQVSKWTTRRELGFTVNTAVWPPGTFADYQSRVPQWTEPLPPLSAAPISVRPRYVAAQLWPWGDFREFDISADLDQVGTETLRFMLFALDWARERSEVEAALDFLTQPYDRETHPQVPRPDWAIAMLNAVAPQHPRLPSLLAMRQA